MIMFARILAFILLLSCLAPKAEAQFTDQRTWAGHAGGTVNALTLSIPNYASHLAGVAIRFIALNDNSGGATVNISSLGVVTIKKPTAAGAVVLTGGEIKAGNIYTLVYDGSAYQIDSGQFDNLAVSRSGAYSTAAVDCGTTQNLTGSAVYLVTVGAATSYPANCVLTFISTDGRFKALSATGLSGLQATSVIPGQVTQIVATASGNWYRNFERVVAGPTLYDNANQGSDTNSVSDCLAPGTGACATFQNAVLRIKSLYDVNQSPIIQADCESVYAQSIVVSGKLTGTTNLLQINGNPSSPGSCSIVPASGTVINVQDGATVQINGFVIGTIGNGTGLYSRQFAILDFTNIIFANVGTGVHVLAQDNGSVNVGISAVGVYSINGNAAAHMQSIGNSHISIAGSQVTSVSSPNVGIVYLASEGGTISNEGTPPAFGGSVLSGIWYIVGGCSSVITGIANASRPSGTAAGSTSGTCPLSPG